MAKVTTNTCKKFISEQLLVADSELFSFCFDVASEGHSKYWCSKTLKENANNYDKSLKRLFKTKNGENIIRGFQFKNIEFKHILLEVIDNNGTLSVIPHTDYNGLPESFKKSIKKVITKTKPCGKDFHYAIWNDNKDWHKEAKSYDNKTVIAFSSKKHPEDDCDCPEFLEFDHGFYYECESLYSTTKSVEETRKFLENLGFTFDAKLLYH